MLASSSIPARALAAPQAVSLSVGSDNHTHLLWNNPDGSVSLWNLDATGSVVTSYNYGPYTDDGTAATPWYAAALATGPNGLSHILWTNPDGRVILWTVTDSGSFTYGVYGPYQDGAPNTPWSATALSVGPDNVVHILWTNPDHRVFLWNVDSAFNFTNVLYGPYTDGPANTPWNATSLATGPDNVSRVVWNNSNGRVMLWNVNASGYLVASPTYGPYQDGAPNTPWSATAVSVGPDNVTHILWNNPDHRVILWNVDSAFSFTYHLYGPTAGMPAVATGVGSDNKSRVLWSGSDGTAQVWTINADGTYTAVTYPLAPALTAAATGSNKVTLYWTGTAGASGYNVYRGTVSGGPYSLIASNITTADPGPGLTNAFMYSDAAGLTSGTEYFYIIRAVQRGGETVQSNEASDTPQAGAVPWDTGDPVQILNAETTQLNAVLPYDIDPATGYSFPADVGLLTVQGPNGVMYESADTEGDPVTSYASPGSYDVINHQLVMNDGTAIPVPSADDTASLGSRGMASRGYPSFRPSALPTNYNQDFNHQFDPSMGIQREVMSLRGYVGLSTTELIFPSPETSPGNIRLVQSGRPDQRDSADIYTGGIIREDARGNPLFRTELDAGLVLASSDPVKDPAWQPVTFNYFDHNRLATPGRPRTVNINGTSLVGNERVLLYGDAAHPLTMSFITGGQNPAYLQGQVALHFTGQYRKIVRTPGPRTITQSGNKLVGAVTLVSPQPQWKWSNRYHMIIKRVTSIAQNIPPGIPQLQNGSFMYGGAWGGATGTANYEGQLYGADGYLVLWNNGPTWLAGGYPFGIFGSGTGYVYYRLGQTFYSENHINLSTTYDGSLYSRNP